MEWLTFFVGLFMGMVLGSALSRTTDFRSVVHHLADLMMELRGGEGYSVNLSVSRWVDGDDGGDDPKDDPTPSLSEEWRNN